MTCVEGIYEFSTKTKKYLATRLRSVSHYKQLLIVAVLFSFVGCIQKNEVEVSLKNPKKKSTESLNITVTNVQVINHQIVITGTNLTAVNDFFIKEGDNSASLQIESKTATSLVANTLSNVSFSAGKVFDFIFSSAQAASTFTVNFSLCDSTLGGKGFNCTIIPNDKEVLSYDATSGKWLPRAVNGLSYIGALDASSGATPAIKPAGQYYIISVAGDIYTGSLQLGVGDWIVSNGLVWQKIDNSTVITSVHGRTGAVISAEGDYSLTQLSDVTLSSPLNNQVLKFNGTTWVNSDLSALGGGTVTSVSATPPLAVANGTSTPAISITQATTSTNGYLSSADWNTFNNKQASITAGTTAQYYRGDKSWQTLDSSVVPENTNLYFTNARALGVPLTGFSATNSAIVSTDTILQAFNKTQGQINNLTSGGSNYLVKNGTDSITGQVTVNAATGSLLIPYTPSDAEVTTAANVQYVKNYADSNKVAKVGDTMTGDLQLNTKLKLKDSGANTISLQAPTTVTASYVLKLPPALGTLNQVLTTDASGNLSWTTPATTAAPTGSAGGDLSGSYPNPSVSQVNGVTAANISAGATLANAATNANTASTIVKRDASGNFTAGTITATLSGNATNVTGVVAIANGGTNATTASGARTNLGLGTASVLNTGASAGSIPLLGTGGISGTNVCTGDGAGAIICTTPLPVGDALTANPLSQFASTTSAQLRGVLSDETGTGLAVFGTAPTFTTNITTPLIIGGSTTTSSLTYKTTTAAGTAGADHIFQVGNNGATEAMRILNNGFVGIGTNNPGAALQINGASGATLKIVDTNQGAGKVLTSDAFGVATWQTPATNGTVTSVTGTAPIVSSGGNTPEISITQATTSTNGYLSSTDWNTFNNKEPAITAGTTSQYLKGNKTLGTFATDVLASLLAGLSTATNAVITASDSVLVAFGKLQKQITDLSSSDANKLSKNTADSITATITVSGAGDIIVPSTPAGMTSAVNKTYVDTNAVANAGGAASVQIGTLAARPAAAAGNTGRMYVAKDSGNEAVYVSTGSAWIKVASNGVSGTLDDTTAAGGTIVKRASSGEVYGQYIVPVTTVTENAACTLPTGTIAKDATGNILTCQ